MKRIIYGLSLISCWLLAGIGQLSAQNPLIMDQYTADPSARVFEGKVYVYPSHDILANENRGRPGWFCMEDYHVFSSANLTEWQDHGVIVSQYDVDWVNPDSYSMWAPDCIARNGKYYFYFPANSRDTGMRRGFGIGVAVADHPEGPYIPQPEPIQNVRGIDPNLFIDQDGQAYLYWSMGNIYVAKLKENMLELASEPQVVKDLPDAGLKEGPYLFERNGIYYMTYPHVANKTERLEYAIGDNPAGPFRFAGVIMDESPTGCWTNHHSIIELKDQWYLFYHHNDLSPKFDKARSIRADSLFFNGDGTIRKVTPTLRGVGVTHAGGMIQIDRYSATGDHGVSIGFLDSLDTFRGWKTILGEKGAWTRYNTVDFGDQEMQTVQIKASSEKGGTVEIRSGSADGPVIARVEIPAYPDWSVVHSNLLEVPSGIHHLVTLLGEGNGVEIDWINFK
ncbi:MAG TPA: carbohydrate-binding protein [Bacteroides sp.]|nr:carbohydrate-binding protein [Bacteroides sp.]